jgi:hypothetical protein
LPGLRGDIARGGMQPYSPNCASAAAISWFLACSPLVVVSYIHGGIKN